MSAIATLLNALVSSFQGLFEGNAWIPLTILFVAVLIATFGIAALFRPRKSIHERVSPPETDRDRPVVSLRHREPDTTFHHLLKSLDTYIVATNEDERSVVRLRMIRAGYFGETAVRLYYIVRVLLAVTLPVAFLLLVPSMSPDMPTNKMIGIAVVSCLAGLYLPYRYVDSKVKARQRLIQEGFPDALDMLVVCVEAGLGLDAAVVRVADQIAKPHPVLAEQFGFIALELRAGKTREEALRNFGMRSGVEDVNTFVMLLIQSEALGADLSQTLRVQPDEMRTKRMMRAEEQAHKLPVKLTMPLVGCILPAMFAVVLGPAMISIIRNVLPHLGN